MLRYATVAVGRCKLQQLPYQQMTAPSGARVEQGCVSLFEICGALSGLGLVWLDQSTS